MTLADLAIRIPAATRVFKRHRLDYCCGGSRTLAQACRERALDPADVLADLEREAAPAPAPSLETAPLEAIIDHIIVRYHDPLRIELPELVAMARRVEARHRDNPGCPRGLASLLEGAHLEILDHLAKEEQVLFPFIRMGARPIGPVTVLTREHDDHGRTLARIRELTGDLVAPPGACTTWRALYLRLEAFESELMDHIHLENNVLFPRALRA